MSGIAATSGMGGQVPGGRFDSYQALRQISEDRNVTVNALDPQDNRERLAQTLSIGKERSLIDKTKDIAANLFSAFRHEFREALQHVGITGQAAAELVREVGRSFIDAATAGKSFSFGMIAAAYKETMVQTGTSFSHALEFSANTLSIEYNHATGELTADTSRMEIDAVRVVRGDNLPTIETAALFDFTDGDGVPTIAGLFDRVQQYLASNGFVDDEAEDGTDVLALPLPDANDAGYDAVLIDDKNAAEAAETAETGTPKPFELPLDGRQVPESVRIQAVEEFTNARQETITRMTLDLMIRVQVGKDDDEPKIMSVENRTNETVEITV